MEFIETLLLETLGGQALIDGVLDFFNSVTDLSQLGLLLLVFFFALAGVIGMIVWILKKLPKFLRVIVILLLIVGLVLGGLLAFGVIDSLGDLVELVT
jgi:hypothetical protein